MTLIYSIDKTKSQAKTACIRRMEKLPFLFALGLLWLLLCWNEDLAKKNGPIRPL
jgi:hypothetical protein